nr:hypothetical protein [Tanacetum cinerariifolium]
VSKRTPPPPFVAAVPQNKHAFIAAAVQIQMHPRGAITAKQTPLLLLLYGSPPLLLFRLLWGSVVGDKRGEWQLVGLWWSTMGRWWRGAADAGGVIGGSSGGVVVAAVGVEWQRRWVVVDLGSGGAWGMRSDRSE